MEYQWLDDTVMREFTEEIEILDNDPPKSLTHRREVTQLVKYIDELRPYEEDYTANKWREIIAKPTTVIGFGRLGDWYQYVLQQKKKLEFLERLKLDKKISPLVELSDNLSIVASGLHPGNIDWENIDEVWDLEMQHFEEKELNIEMKINVKSKGCVSINVYANYWGRYTESEDVKVGDSGKIEVVVTTSTVAKLKKFVGLCVVAHDVTDCDYQFETPDVPIKLNLAFFKDLSALLGVSDASLVKFILDTCQYPFMKCDWKKSMPKTKLDIPRTAKSYEHIHNEIAANVPSAQKIFKKGYMKHKNHIEIVDYLLGFLLAKVRNAHCKLMTLYALLDNTCYDFSAANELLLERTHWHKVSETLCRYDMAIVDENNQHEFSVQVKLLVEPEEIPTIEIMVSNVASNIVKKKILEAFQPITDHIRIISKNHLKDFQITKTFELQDASIVLSNDQDRFLVVLAKLMHFDWEVSQFWKFLHEVLGVEEEPSERFIHELMFYSYHYDAAGEEKDEEDPDANYGESENVSEAFMQLSEELKDITKDVDPMLLELQRGIAESRCRQKLTRSVARRTIANQAAEATKEDDSNSNSMDLS